MVFLFTKFIVVPRGPIRCIRIFIILFLRVRRVSDRRGRRSVEGGGSPFTDRPMELQRYSCNDSFGGGGVSEERKYIDDVTSLRSIALIASSRPRRKLPTS